MQHVKRSWLTIYAWLLLIFDIAIVAIYYYINAMSESPDTFNHWGITPLIVGISCIHAIYILIFFPFIRRKSEWLASTLSVTLFVFLLAALIETSHYNNITIRIAYILFVFSLGLIGPFLPIATVIATWVFFLFTYLSVLQTAGSIALRFEILIDILVTCAGFLGWVVFKRLYIKTKDKEAIALSRLLEQERLKSSVMLEFITDGVLVVNTKGRIQVLNEATAVLLGQEKNEVLHKDYRKVLGATDDVKTSSTTAINRALETHRSAQAVDLIRSKSGTERFVDIVASPIFETIEAKPGQAQLQEKLMVGVIAILRDVDKQKRQEQRKSDFISTASHEMRTPVAAIEGFLELAINPKIRSNPEKSLEYTQKALGTTKQLGELFKDLLTISENEAKNNASMQPVLEPISVVTLLSEIHDKYQVQAQEKNLSLQFNNRLKDGDQAQVGASRKLEEVIENLTQNALKYTETGSVTLEVTGDTEKICIAVKDTGIGIAKEDIPQLFQKFSRVDNSKTRTIGGTGLGLYIAKMLVESMGGRIWVESEFEKGSTFFVVLDRFKQVVS